MVCHIGGQLGTKVVISALGMLALYMCFNGSGIWGGETIMAERNTPNVFGTSLPGFPS